MAKLIDDVCLDPTQSRAEILETPQAGTLYCNQPMLGIIKSAFPRQASVAGFAPMAAQLGFAVGLLLLVPLGDRVKRLELAGGIASFEDYCGTRYRSWRA